MLDFFSSLGESFTAGFLAFIIMVILVCIDVEWTCSMCGKTTHGNILQALFQMCDHGGNFSG